MDARMSSKRTCPNRGICAETDGQSRADNELLIVRQVEGVTHTRRNDRSRAAFHGLLECEPAFGNVFIPARKHFEHEIEIPADSVNRARADIVIRQGVALMRVRKHRHPGIKMKRPAVADLL